MQLIFVSFLLFVLLFTQDLKAQVRQKLSFEQHPDVDPDSSKTSTVVYEDPNWRQVDVDFLSSYYVQDGNMSPVTGGIGTEYLTDFTQKIILSVPVTPRLKLNIDGGYDFYTSASSDKIDPIRSDDSGYDTRVHGNLGFAYQLKPQHTIGARIGGSGEYDYSSAQVGINYAWESKDQNTGVLVNFQSFIDQWDLIYPIELRDQGQLVPTSNRQSHNLAIGISRILDRKTQVSLNLEAVMMNGLLSTPFHRVYFQEQQQARVEQLPGSRLKLPVGVRLNRYLNEWMVLRMYYRYYWDNWGIQAHTASVELPIKPTRFLALTPFYRFHTQTAADYYAPYAAHSIFDQFYTSDTDLAALQSHAFGMGISYQPAKGIAKVKLPFTKNEYVKLKQLELKYSHYERTTGLRADIVSFGMGFTLF